MCVNGELVSALEVMNARWDNRGRRSMSVMKMVDGVMSMVKMVDGVMSMVKMVVSCHSFGRVWYYFDFWFFIFLYLLV